MSTVVLAPYDERWPAVFAALRDVYLHALGELATAVEHVGSTAIPGMLAKPVIDIDIVIARGAELPLVVAALARLGYRHNGCQGIPGREAFKRDDHSDVPRDGSGRSWPAHNLYVCTVDATELHRHLVFRDWLRAHPERAAAYADLKRGLALLHGDDRDAYCEAKTELIEMTIREADASGPDRRPLHEPAMHTPQIHTERLLLRPFVPTDAADVFAYASNPRVSRYTTWETHQTIADSESFLDMVLGRDDDEHVWAICLADDRRARGAIELGLESQTEAEIHYVLAESLWNRGLMTEAARAVIAWGLQSYPALTRIASRAVTENVASHRVMEHCGMHFEGVREHRWQKLVDPVEQREYALLRPPA